MRSFAAACTAALLSVGLLAACGGAAETREFEDPHPIAEEEPIAPAPGGLRRLRAAQYVNSIRTIFGDVAASAAMPPNDASLHGFDSIGAAELALPQTAVEEYETSARRVADAVISDAATRDHVLPCEPSGPSDDACHQAFVESIGRLAWRRPLTLDEVAPLVDVATAAAAEYESFEIGLTYALSCILQSPYFLYIVEIGEPDPDDPTRRRLTDQELASRMSFFLLDKTPDAALLDKVAAGALATSDDVKAAAREMLSKPEARETLATFYSELFHLRDLDGLAKSADIFPLFSPALAQAMKEETLRLIDDIVWTRSADAREIYVADYAFINSDLAALYGVPSPISGFQKVTLPSDQKRAGLLGSASFLARFAHPAKTSPTKRGLFVNTALLCYEIPPPPPGVNTTLPEDDPSVPKTARMKLEVHMKDDACSSCHRAMDPIGFALENYDGIGAFRATDQGLAIDPASSIDGLGSFASARDLGQTLRDDPRSPSCMVKNLFRNSMGHLETRGELAAILKLEEAFASSGYNLQELMVAIVASPAFQLVGEPK